jgi:hypothetical protein
MVLMLFTMALSAPRLVRLEVVNRAGEPVTVQLQGLGYDFKEGEYNFQGAFYWLHLNDPPLDAEGDWLDVETTTLYTVLKDRYAVDVFYPEKELVGSDSVTCLNNWTPKEWDGKAVYFDAIKGGENANRIVIKKCNTVPAEVGNPFYGQIKWNRYYLLDFIYD